MKKGNEQGWSNYSGHVVTGLFSQFILRRVGVKGKLGDSDKYKLKKPEDGELFKKRSEGTGQGLKVPQGLTQAQFDKVSSMIREKVGHK
ncbi:hypothetical protein [Paenibacillus lacisoli]|uniref:hypothetical protein n=1 Tax=Paenibacillus lacisoli TaxID=3064525 RepID=UPI00272AA98E|nr:hypothetical protein [Paenibacillus sp. JX-17]